MHGGDSVFASLSQIRSVNTGRFLLTVIDRSALLWAKNLRLRLALAKACKANTAKLSLLNFMVELKLRTLQASTTLG